MCSVSSIMDVKSDGFIWFSLNSMAAFFKHIQPCTIPLKCFANDRTFQINFVKVWSETAFLSIIENKQWSFSQSYSFSISVFTLIEDLLYSPVPHTFLFFCYILGLVQKTFAFTNQNQQNFYLSLSFEPCEQ